MVSSSSTDRFRTILKISATTLWVWVGFVSIYNICPWTKSTHHIIWSLQQPSEVKVFYLQPSELFSAQHPHHNLWLPPIEFLHLQSWTGSLAGITSPEGKALLLSLMVGWWLEAKEEESSPLSHSLPLPNPIPVYKQRREKQLKTNKQTIKGIQKQTNKEKAADMRWAPKCNWVPIGGNEVDSTNIKYKVQAMLTLCQKEDAAKQANKWNSKFYFGNKIYRQVR